MSVSVVQKLSDRRDNQKLIYQELEEFDGVVPDPPRVCSHETA